ncbi:MAG: kelch repeat-containing protein [Mucilaginibacter sp.]
MKKISLLIFSIITLFTMRVQAQFEGYSWKTLTTNGNFLMREEADFVNVNGLFYLIGGRKIQEISVFNPKTNTWATAAKPPIELHHFQAVVYKDEIYLVGAMTAGYPHEKPVENIYIYNPKLDTWRTGAVIPADRRRGSGGVVIYKNKFYIAAGIQDGHWTGNVTWFDEYDPKTDQWKKLPDAPTARDHTHAAIVGDKLYLIGGVQSDAMEKKGLEKVVAEVDVYDFKTGKWSIADAKLPIPRAGNGSVVIGNDIIIIAGESNKQKAAHNEVDAYNTKTGVFRSLPPLVQGRHAVGAIYYDKKIYTCAGVGNSGGTPLLNSIEVFSKD